MNQVFDERTHRQTLSPEFLENACGLTGDKEQRETIEKALIDFEDSYSAVAGFRSTDSMWGNTFEVFVIPARNCYEDSIKQGMQNLMYHLNESNR